MTLFFIISGFLLSIPFLKKPNNDLKLYYKKRIIRIIPIFWMVVISAGFITGVIFTDPRRVARACFFVFGAWDLFPFSAPWWTLRTEMEFYLLLPLVMPLVHFRKGRLVLAAMVPLYPLVLLAGMNLIHDPVVRSYFMQSAIRHAPTFGMGIIMAWIYITYGPALSSYFKERKIFSRGLSDAFVIISFFLLSLVLREVSLRGGTMGAAATWPQRFVYETVPWCMIFMGIILLPMRLKPLLSNRAFAWFGEISYPFYFVHVPLLFYVKVFFSSRVPLQKGWNPATFEIVAVTFVLALAISFLLNRFIEKPILRYKNNMQS